MTEPIDQNTKKPPGETAKTMRKRGVRRFSVRQASRLVVRAHKDAFKKLSEY